MPTIYAAMRTGLLVVRGDAPGGTAADAGTAWQATTRLDGMDLECVAAHPDAPGRAFCGTFGDGLYRTTDGGETWSRVGRSDLGAHGFRSAGGDADGDQVMSVAVDPSDPDVVWVGTEPSAVYRSSDGGDTWEPRPGLTDLPSEPRWSFPPRPDTHHVRWLEVDPADPDSLYVGIEAGALVRTRDGGETWLDHPPGAGRDTHSVATHPDDPGRAYQAAGDGYAESDDGGETWWHPDDGLDHGYCWSVAVDPASPNTILLSAARGARSAHSLPAETHVYRTRAGERWVRIGDGESAGAGLPTGDGVLRYVLESGPGDGEFWALSNTGLFHSTDAGDSWTRLDVEWPERFDSQTARGLVVVP